MNQKFYYFFDHTKIISCYFFKSGFEIRISCKRINEWLKQDLWLLRQSDSSLLANVLSVTKGGGNYLFSKQFFTFKYLTVKFVGNLCKCHNGPELTIPFWNYWGKICLLNNFNCQIYPGLEDFTLIKFTGTFQSFFCVSIFSNHKKYQ